MCVTVIELFTVPTGDQQKASDREEVHEMLQLEYFSLIPIDELENADENTW